MKKAIVKKASVKKALIAAALAGAVVTTGGVVAGQSQAHLHIGHVLTQWGDTPHQAGLMPTALEEAKIVSQHAQLSAKKATDLAWMKLHNTHVIHALDPDKVAQGPGMGYGLIKAATGVAKHIGAAAKQADASDAVKLHSEHVAASAQNAVARGQKILSLSEQVQRSEDVAEVAALVEQIVVLAGQIIEGVDANGDGTITWHPEEGGLSESNKHANIMAKLEKL